MGLAKIINKGNVQSVNIPKEYRLKTDEVYINKIGDVITITPLTSIRKEFEEGCNMLSDDFFEEGIPDSISCVREEL